MEHSSSTAESGKFREWKSGRACFQLITSSVVLAGSVYKMALENVRISPVTQNPAHRVQDAGSEAVPLYSLILRDLPSAVSWLSELKGGAGKVSGSA